MNTVFSAARHSASQAAFNEASCASLRDSGSVKPLAASHCSKVPGAKPPPRLFTATPTRDVITAALRCVGLAEGVATLSSSFLMTVPDEVDVLLILNFFADSPQAIRDRVQDAPGERPRAGSERRVKLDL